MSHIRPIIDFYSNAWNVGYLGDIKLLESVQQRWTREIADVSHLAYVETKGFGSVLYFWSIGEG